MKAPEYDFTFTRSQRTWLAVIVLGVLGWAGYHYLTHPAYVPNPQSPEPPRARELADRIDPNTCDVAELAALPGVGEKRARDILAFRDMAARRDPGTLAFATREDLLKVKGVGRAMMLQLEPFLIFSPTTQPTTQRD